MMNNSRVKVHAYIICHNESKMLPFSIEHYSKFCSKIFIIDNASDDGSVDNYFGERNIVVIDFPTPDGFNDMQNVFAKQRFYKEYSRPDGRNFCGEKPDFVITCDADEHIYHPEILSVLKVYKEEGVTVPRIAGFNMVHDLFPEKNEGECLSDIVRYGFRDTNFDKPILFSVDFDMTFSVGCHPAGTGYQKMLANSGCIRSKTTEVALLHFKHLGQHFFERTGINRRRLSKKSREMGWGKHYLKDDLALEEKRDEFIGKSREVISGCGKVLPLG